MNKASLQRLILQLAFFCMLAACQDADRDHDVIVVGGGLMGSSSAWQLAMNGQRVLLLEKQDAQYSEGSSLGETRISRSLGGEDDIWSYMHNRTVAEVARLIDFLNSHEPGHSMSDVYTTSPVNYVRHRSHASRIESIQQNQKDRYEYARNAEEAAALFDLEMPADTIMWREYKQHSGTINPEALIGLLHKAIELLDGEVRYLSRVDRLTRLNNGYQLLVTDLKAAETETLHTQKLVTAAGPYTGSLLSEIAPYFDQLITPRRVFLAYFALDADLYGAWPEEDKQRFSDLYPAINSTVPTREGSFFTMLEGRTETGAPIVKIGGHNQRSDIRDLDSVWQEALSDSEIAWSSESTARHLSLLGLGIKEQHLSYVQGYSCVYSLTDSEVPYVSQIRDTQGIRDPNMVVVAGLSGVGAKGSLAYGLIAANSLLGIEEQEAMYQRASRAFGYERLLADLAELAAAAAVNSN